MTINNKQKEEFDKFLNEQFRILKGHHERIMLKIWNKFAELKSKSGELAGRRYARNKKST